VILLIGGALVAAAPQMPFAGLLGLAVLALGAAGGTTAVLEQRWDGRRPGPRLATDPTGAPSTLVACAPWSGLLRWWAALLLVVPTSLGALLALLGQRWALAGVLAAVAAALWWLLAPHVVPQGVHLGARALTVVHHGRPQRADWDEVVLVSLRRWVVVRLSSGRRVRFTPRQLSVHPDELAFALSVCALDPAARRELGTPASLRPDFWDAGPSGPDPWGVGR